MIFFLFLVCFSPFTLFYCFDFSISVSVFFPFSVRFMFPSPFSLFFSFRLFSPSFTFPFPFFLYLFVLLSSSFVFLFWVFSLFDTTLGKLVPSLYSHVLFHVFAPGPPICFSLHALRRGKTPAHYMATHIEATH